MSAREVITGAYELTEKSGLGDHYRTLQRKIELGIRTTIPATVVSYNSADQTVNVTLNVLSETVDLNIRPNNKRTNLPIALNGIPVGFYQSQTSWVRVPIRPGTTGLIHVCDRSIEAWLENGLPQVPLLAMTHALHDGIFVPGVQPEPVRLPSGNPNVLELEDALAVHIGKETTAEDTVAKYAATSASIEAISEALGALGKAIDAVASVAGAAPPGMTVAMETVAATLQSLDTTLSTIKLKAK